MITLQSLRHRYADRQVLDLPSFAAAQGEQWLVIGPSGSGKTTLLHVLAGLLRPSTGRVVVADTDLGSLHGPTLDRFRGRHIGVVFQRMHLIDALTVRQNLAIAPWLADAGDAAIGRIDGLLDSLGLTHRRDAYPTELSAGETQRVAIARAVINHPRVLLADEPTSSLDDASCEAVLSLLMQQASATGATLLIVTHDQRVRDRIANRLELSSDVPA